MRHDSYPYSAWGRDYREEHWLRVNWLRLALLLAFGAVFVALFRVETRCGHSGVSFITYALFLCPVLPRRFGDHQESEHAKSEEKSDFALSSLLEDIFRLADGILSVGTASFVCWKQSGGELFHVDIRRETPHVRVLRSFGAPAPSMWRQPWQGAFVTKDSLGETSITGANREGNEYRGVLTPLELSQLWCGEEFEILFVNKLRVDGGWRGYVAMADPKCPEDHRRAVHILDQIIGACVRHYEIQISNCSHLRSEERKHVARDLHDGVIQSLSAAEMRLDLARRELAHNEADPVDAIEVVASAQNVLICEIRKLRQEIGALRSGSYDGSLRAHLDCFIRGFERETGIASVFSCNLNEKIIAPELALEVIYLIRESLSNVRKHSNSSRVEIALNGEDAVHLTIQDNGCGFGFSEIFSSDQQATRGFGPCTISERVAANHGSLSIQSLAETGTKLCIYLPIQGRICPSSKTPVLYSSPAPGIDPDRKLPRSVDRAVYNPGSRTVV